MNKEKDFFKTCFNTVASLEVKNESQAIAKEVVLSEVEDLQQENKQLKDNQVRAMNKIRDFIDNANCEIKESKYSNDKHGLYWELFRKDLTTIQKLIKGINTNEYVNIPKWREKELLNLEDNWNKLKEYMTDAEQIYKESDDKYVKDMREMGIRHAYRTILYKMQELEQGSESNGQMGG